MTMKDKILSEIAKCQARLDVLQEMLGELGGADKPVRKPRAAKQPKAVAKAKPGPKPKGKPGPKPKAKPEPKPKAAKAPKAEKAPEAKRTKRAYPADDIVLGALTQEPQGISDIAEGAKSDPKLTVVVVKKLVAAKKVLQEGGGRWTTYRLA
jgi:outer membrane biosynthesis protein TonB